MLLHDLLEDGRHQRAVRAFEVGELDEGDGAPSGPLNGALPTSTLFILSESNRAW